MEKRIQALEARVTKLEGRREPLRNHDVESLRNHDVERLVDSLFELWSLDTQGTPLRDTRWNPEMYREAIKNWWGEEESHDVITQAIEEVIVTTCQEQGLEITYQMVDWLRNTMGYEP